MVVAARFGLPDFDCFLVGIGRYEFFDDHEAPPDADDEFPVHDFGEYFFCAEHVVPVT